VSVAPSPALVRLGTVDSTQTVAFRLAAEGAGDRTVVVAEHQTAGRGRRGHRWEDETGASLLLSILVRSALPLAQRPRLSFAAAVAVADALASVAGLHARLRWPNDVLVDGGKIAGILLEGRGDDVVVGIGVNVFQQSFTGVLAGRATSVALACGRRPDTGAAMPGWNGDREGLLASVLQAFDVWRERVEQGDFAIVRDAWLARADTIGRTVSAGGLAGVAIGMDDDGALLVQAGDAIHRITAGALEEGT